MQRITREGKPKNDTNITEVIDIDHPDINDYCINKKVNGEWVISIFMDNQEPNYLCLTKEMSEYEVTKYIGPLIDKIETNRILCKK